MGFLSAQTMVEPGAKECLFVLRVGNLTPPFKFSKPTLPNGLNQLQVRMAGEVLKGSGFTVFLTHKEQRNEGRKNCHCGGQFEPFTCDSLRQAVSERAIPNLVVILRKDHELPDRN